jgi:FixJ family two-component response regulator
MNMTDTNLPRIIVVDDEEAILETMTFTFMDGYEVLTTTDAQEALRMLDEHSPVHVVITDQRMPGMTGVELLKEVYDRYPDTVRIMLTGFADSEATIQAINDGHVYAYINKPWEQDDLKRVVRRAVEHFDLACENRRLVDDLRGANSIMQAVMDLLIEHPNLPRLVQHETLTGGQHLTPMLREWIAPLFVSANEAAAGTGAWRDDQVPLLVLAVYNVVVGYFSAAAMLGTLSGDDLLSRDALERQTEFLLEFVNRLFPESAPNPALRS